MNNQVYTLADLAAITGQSYDWLTRSANRDTLYKRKFPRPLNLPGRPRWSKAAVDSWINAGPIGVPAPATDTVSGRPSGQSAEIITIEQGKDKLRAALAS